MYDHTCHLRRSSQRNMPNFQTVFNPLGMPLVQLQCVDDFHIFVSVIDQGEAHK